MTVPVPSDGAAVVIVKFTDLQCPQCGITFFEMRPILSRYQAQFPGAVKMVTKDYPLQMECNSSMPRPLHTAACDAAVAVRLAKQRNKGESLEEYLYGHQPTMSPASVRDAAFAIAGVQDLDLQYPRVIGEVKADVGLGRLLGVTGTPTLFINGVRIVAAAAQTIDLAIAYELKKAGRIK
jgi:protein-disulfide isomerase